MVSFPVGVDVDAIAKVLIIFPAAHIAIFVGERVDAFSSPAVLILSDVLSSIGIGYFLKLVFYFS